MFTVTPKQAYDEALHCMSRGLTPLITSSPGMGKSSIMHQLARDHNLKLIDVRLSQCTPEDLSGFPMRSGNKATFTPFDIFPVEGDEIPAGYEGWLLFLDEMTSATKPVQAAAYKLILDRMVGSYKLHSHVAVVAAGNKMSDKAVVNAMSTALQSRVIHYELSLSSKEWLNHAFSQGFDHRVTAFIGYMPNKLMDFRPDHQDKTFACPRTWEFLSRLIKGEVVSEDIGARVAGTIGEGMAVEFITFAQEFDRLPKVADILANPNLVPVPKELSTKFATVTMLIEHITDKTADQILEYLDHFDLELQILFFRGAVARHPKLRGSNKAFDAKLLKMVRYIQ